MTTTTYVPRGDSLAALVIRFFQDNEDEVLTLDDIVTKWSAVRGNVHTLLTRAVQVKMLQRTQNPDGEYVYSPGPQIPSEPVATKGRAAPAASGFVASRVHFDFSKVKVEEGVPFTPGGTKGQNKWEPLFSKLTKAGQSVAIPADIKSAVLAAALKRNKERRGVFRVQLTGPGEARVWRVE